MAESNSHTELGLNSLKAWAELSEQERDESRAAFRFVDPNLPEPVLGVVLVEALPPNAVASIIADPVNSGCHLVVFSRRTYSYGTFLMAGSATITGKPFLTEFRRLDVTASGAVIAPDGQSLFDVKMPDRSSFGETESLTHLITVATSRERINVPDLGPGTVYRFRFG